MAGKNKKTNSFIIILAMFATALIAFFLFIIFNGKETYTSSQDDDVKVGVVVCNAGNLEDGFFNDDSAEKFEQEIKITFNNGVVDKMSYNLAIEYQNDELARKKNAIFHANYNKSMGKEAEDLIPTFYDSGQDVKIGLFVNKKSLNNVVGKIFYLTDSERMKLFQLTPDDVIKIYEDVGFACKKID